MSTDFGCGIFLSIYQIYQPTDLLIYQHAFLNIVYVLVVHIYIYAYMHTYIHTDTHTQTKLVLLFRLPCICPQAASWDCPKWVNFYRVPDCAADQILSSPSCDEGCHRAFAADPLFVFRRCPETCTSDPAVSRRFEGGERCIRCGLRTGRVVCRP